MSFFEFRDLNGKTKVEKLAFKDGTVVTNLEYDRVIAKATFEGYPLVTENSLVGGEFEWEIANNLFVFTRKDENGNPHQVYFSVDENKQLTVDYPKAADFTNSEYNDEQEVKNAQPFFDQLAEVVNG